MQYEAMVDIENSGCEYCTPKGTTRAGTHHNIIKMIVEAKSMEEAERIFNTIGKKFSNIKEIDNTCGMSRK